MNHSIQNLLRFLAALGLLQGLTSCLLHRLEVQTQYLSHENLASYHIGTPDPHLDQPIIGQRLLVQWSLCSSDVEGHALFLHLKVRFRNHQEQDIKIPINKKRGFYVYDLTNQNYCESGGILTYLAEIYNESCVLESWKHPLWADLITFDFSQAEQEESEK